MEKHWPSPERVNTDDESLEDFYADPSWMGGSKKRTCGAYRVPNGKVRCILAVMENGRHYGNHSGYDAAIRLHFWANEDSSPIVPGG